MNKTLQQKAEEARTMCKLKGEGFLDNSDRTIAFEGVYASEVEAEQAVRFFTEKARSVENEPCRIEQNISPFEQGYLMQMQIEFSCQAEVILFQMAVR